MATVYPFRPIVYANRSELSGVIAPPYDVLDGEGKRRLLAKDPANVVAIDLPHTPAKELGPQKAYDDAAAALSSMLESGTLKRLDIPTMFAYRQTFKDADGVTTVQRSGMACCIETQPFGPRKGGGVLPHEETFSGPKEDRFALMKATKAQLSPIFGLHADEQGNATKLIKSVMGRRKPDRTAKTDDGTLHEVWQIQDSATIRAYEAALEGQDIFIADGHHRYTTGLNYLKGLEAAGEVSSKHPARRCMFVLIGMSDPGLVIWPTHRVLGGMKGYSLAAFTEASKDDIRMEAVEGGVAALGAAIESRVDFGDRRFGVYDFHSNTGFLAAPKSDDPLAERFADKPRAWRDLTVAFVQYVVVEKICQPKLNGGEGVKWAFPHTIAEVEAIGKGTETGAGGGKDFAQLGIIVRPTPLAAVKDVSRGNQLMPQKSTFFYPKLATGLFINPLE